MESPILGNSHSAARPPQARRQRRIAGQGPRLHFSGRVDAGLVREELARTPAFFSDPGLAYVDLVDATSFDLTGLIVLLAAVSDRVSAAIRTKFRLPSSDLARHVLRMWGFPAAAGVVARAPFRTLVDRSDLEYFGEIWPRLTSDSDVSPAHYLMAQKPFGMSAYRITDIHSVLQMMDDEVEQWRSYAMTKLLQKLLPDKSVDDVARVIVQELIANILQHAGATIAIIAARLDIDEDSGSLSNLSISLWDDGVSIINALRTCLESETPPQPPSPGNRDVFRLQPGSWNNGLLVYPSDWVPDSTAADPEILLASLYIGISPFRVEQDLSSMGGGDPALTDAPEGLLPLYRTALHYFNGSLAVTSGNSSVSLVANSKISQYKTSLALDDRQPPLTGNLVTVKLPVIDG